MSKFKKGDILIHKATGEKVVVYNYDDVHSLYHICAGFDSDIYPVKAKNYIEAVFKKHDNRNTR